MASGLVVASSLVAALLAASGFPAAAQDSLSLVTGAGYPPFADPHLPGGGTAVVLVRRIFETMDVGAQIEVLPWRRGYEETLRGRFAATFPYVRTPEREADFLYSAPLIDVRQVVFAAVDRSFAYHGPEDLRGRRVCLALGYAPPRALEAMIAQHQIERLTPPSAEMCPALVHTGRADFFVQDQRIGIALVAKAGLDGRVAVVPGPPVGTAQLHLIVPRNREDATGLIARFDAALARLRAGGGYERLPTQ